MKVIIKFFIMFLIFISWSMLLIYTAYFRGYNKDTIRQLEIYESGYRTGVECRGMLSAPSCYLLLEKTK